jgi:hypothetical protein
MAEEYLARNPELLNEAATLVERWRTEGLFGKRAQALVHINALFTTWRCLRRRSSTYVTTFVARLVAINRLGSASPPRGNDMETLLR